MFRILRGCTLLLSRRRGVRLDNCRGLVLELRVHFRLLVLATFIVARFEQGGGLVVG